MNDDLTGQNAHRVIKHQKPRHTYSKALHKDLWQNRNDSDDSDDCDD